MTEYKTAIDEWTASFAYAGASNPVTLGASSSQRLYLENRLLAAFMAGWNAREPALFIALKAEYYDLFDRGEKQTEYRVHGKRWNHTTCRVGRTVTLSRGYGKQHRLRGTIVGIEVMPNRRAPEVFREIYGADEECIAIHIELKR